MPLKGELADDLKVLKGGFMRSSSRAGLPARLGADDDLWLLGHYPPPHRSMIRDGSPDDRLLSRGDPAAQPSVPDWTGSPPVTPGANSRGGVQPWSPTHEPVQGWVPGAEEP